MFDKYLITGATGFLGRAVAAELVRHDAQVRALVLHNDPYISLLPKEVRTVAGDVCDKSSLADFFADADSRTCVILDVYKRQGPGTGTPSGRRRRTGAGRRPHTGRCGASHSHRRRRGMCPCGR